MICPYYDEKYQRCELAEKVQNQSAKDDYCLTSDNWRRCYDYTRSSFDEKASKKLRSNPDL